MRGLFSQYLVEIAHNPLAQVVSCAIALDTIFGCLRAIKKRKFNSNFGIDGAIRKAAMMISVMFLMLTDFLIKVNLIFFIPVDMRTAIGLSKVGLGEFFSLLYIIYEAISILKNMYLCGLPIPRWAKSSLEKMLTQMTAEVKDGET